VVELESLGKGLKCSDAVGCASPVPDSNAIINVAGPFNQIFGMGVAMEFFVQVEEQCGPHACWGHAHGSP